MYEKRITVWLSSNGAPVEIRTPDPLIKSQKSSEVKRVTEHLCSQCYALGGIKRTNDLDGTEMIATLLNRECERLAPLGHAECPRRASGGIRKDLL